MWRIKLDSVVSLAVALDSVLISNSFDLSFIIFFYFVLEKALFFLLDPVALNDEVITVEAPPEYSWYDRYPVELFAVLIGGLFRKAQLQRNILPPKKIGFYNSY